ncbi:MAG: DUF6600 domain-containing protein [Polaromonas sp.]
MTTPQSVNAAYFGFSDHPEGRQRSMLSYLGGYLLLLLVALVLALLQPVVWAQEAPPRDPPGRVARLNLAQGAVSFAPAEASQVADDNGWRPAPLNRPLTSGDKLWTGPQTRSELHAGSTALRLGGQTSLDFLALDDDLTQLRLPQGTLQLRVRTLYEGQRLEIDTPNLAFVVSQPGSYRLDVSPAGNTTRVVAQAGAGTIYGEGVAPVSLGSRQQVSFTGTHLEPVASSMAFQDSFDAWAASRDRREDRSVAARYLPREIVGYQQLDDYGDWAQDPGYGAVWVPCAMPVNWAPYRAGHWSWIAPWGWTWVDDAPWGFAPFHYGRWAQLGPRWAWVPGRLAPRPVYAPALVAFVGGNLGNGNGATSWNISITYGRSPQPAVGWFPLAPGEAFRPAYRVSPRYVTQVNNNIVINHTINVTQIYRYQRQPAAVTAVSREDFAHGQAVRTHWRALNAIELGRSQVVPQGNALPQHPEHRQLQDTSRVQAAAPPPAAVVARAVLRSHREDKNERRDVRKIEPGDALTVDRRSDHGGLSGQHPDRHEGQPPGQAELRRDDGRAVQTRRDASVATPAATAIPASPAVARVASPQPAAATQPSTRDTRPDQKLRDTGAPLRHEPLQARAPVAPPPASVGARNEARPTPGLPPPAAHTAADASASQAEALQRQQQQQAQHEQARQQAGQRQQSEAASHEQARKQQEAARKQQMQQAQAQAALQQQRTQQERTQPAPAHAAQHEQPPRKEPTQEHSVTRHADAATPRDPHARHDPGSAPNPPQ